MGVNACIVEVKLLPSMRKARFMCSKRTGQALFLRFMRKGNFDVQHRELGGQFSCICHDENRIWED